MPTDQRVTKGIVVNPYLLSFNFTRHEFGLVHHVVYARGYMLSECEIKCG